MVCGNTFAKIICSICYEDLKPIVEDLQSISICGHVFHELWYVMGIGEAEAFSERLKRELQALEAANVHAILENEPLIDEVTLVVAGLESTTNCVEDMDEWLGIFNVKLRHMREDIESIKACLLRGSFDEARMLQNVEACEWLIGALHGLEVPNLDPSCSNMRNVKEKRAELEKLKTTFVRRASEFLKNYFASLVDFMISDKSYFSQDLQ
ncbi:Exocyst complex component SEC3A [Camellia lanceoleosa]|uniref:Exocyst complex component SEC3A n=1 Tax=Camellia lanceoleosa TaxID=1840588 RepID=A0ACC0I7W1_9ERIC|nr:Exocyst complex component SEC3A [Camellia lanceoleosa]